jgi:hypothetical protein
MPMTADDWTVTINPADCDHTMGLRKLNPVTIQNARPAAALYVVGGMPLPPAAAFGMTRAVDFLIIQPPLDGYVYKFDRANNTLLMFRAGPATHNHDMLILGGVAPVEAVGVSGAGSDQLSKDAATNRTIAGADAATKGGVLGATLVAGELAECDGATLAPAGLFELIAIGD